MYQKIIEIKSVLANAEIKKEWNVNFPQNSLTFLYEFYIGSITFETTPLLWQEAVPFRFFQWLPRPQIFSFRRNEKLNGIRSGEFGD